MPTFSAFSVAQGFVVQSDGSDDEEEDPERQRRIEEERQGRMCPICLGKPVAGRMTKCGHIFCFPCILHFIQLSDLPRCAKCPICGDTVHESMLKSVRYLDAATLLGSAQGNDNEHEMMVGEMEGFEEAKAIDEAETSTHRIHMRLIQRPQMTTLALPTSSTWPSDAIPPHTAPWHFLPDVLSYSRFTLATPDYMVSELERELRELNTEWEMLRGDTLGRDFVRAAKEKVERQVGKVKAELMTEMVRRSEKASREAWDDAAGGQEREKERERLWKDHDIKVEADVPTEFIATQDVTIPPDLYVEPNPMPPKKPRRRHANVTPVDSIPPSPSYYFYQSSLGANVFLHPLDIRILLAHYKSYSLFPASMSLRSTGYDPGTINDELRKRCKYLSHLPAGTEAVFVEAELEELIGKESLTAFEQPLRARREKRRARVKREDRAKIRWEKAEREKIPVMVTAEDREFSLALERSTVETTWTEPFQPGSASSSTSHHYTQSAPGPSPSTSPAQFSAWGSHPQPRPTFASALHSNATPPRPRRRDPGESDLEVDAAWEAFDRLSMGTGELDLGTIRESEKGSGGGRKGGKKNQKKLVLGGGGRRA